MIQSHTPTTCIKTFLLSSYVRNYMLTQMESKSKSMKVTTTIFAHGAALETVKRHYPIWKKNSDNILIISPIDDPCTLDNVDYLTHGKKQHSGYDSLKRDLFGMKSALSYDSDYYVFLEYDAVMLQRPQPRPIVQGNLFNDYIFLNRLTEPMSQCICFLHFPWVFPSNVLKFFTESVEVKEDGCPFVDSWIAQKIMDLNLEIHNTRYGEAYSQNTIEPKHFNELSMAIQNGAYAIHGIKEQETLDIVMQSFEKTIG